MLGHFLANSGLLLTYLLHTFNLSSINHDGHWAGMYILYYTERVYPSQLYHIDDLCPHGSNSLLMMWKIRSTSSPRRDWLHLRLVNTQLNLYFFFPACGRNNILDIQVFLAWTWLDVSLWYSQTRKYYSGAYLTTHKSWNFRNDIPNKEHPNLTFSKISYFVKPIVYNYM